MRPKCGKDRQSKQQVLLTDDEREFRQWMDVHVRELLTGVGICEGQTVLDFGCGGGKFALETAGIVGRKGKVYALDIDRDKLKALRSKARAEGLENLKTIVNKRGSVTIGLAAGSMDVVLLYDVIQLVEQKRELVRELFRVLKPQGFLSVFPMHFGKEKMLELVGEERIFRLGNDYGVILNLLPEVSARWKARLPER